MWYLWDYHDLVAIYDDKDAADQDCKWLVEDYYRMMQKRITKTVIKQNIKVTECRPRSESFYAGKEHAQ